MTLSGGASMSLTGRHDLDQLMSGAALEPTTATSRCCWSAASGRRRRCRRWMRTGCRRRRCWPRSRELLAPHPALLGERPRRVIEALVAEIDLALTPPARPDPARAGVPGARGHLARPVPARPGQRQGSGRQDPRARHQQARAAAHAAQVPRQRLGPEPDFPADLRGGVRPVRRRAVRPAGRRLRFDHRPGRRAPCCPTSP